MGAVFTAWSFWWKGTPRQLIETPLVEWSWEFCTPNVLLATFGLFLVFTTIRSGKTPPFITSLSRMSFGMYLMHMFFLAPIASYVVAGDQAHPLLPVGLAIPVIALSSYLCSYVTTWLLSHLPGSKWIVGA